MNDIILLKVEYQRNIINEEERDSDMTSLTDKAKRRR